jgi:hypothetical protein
MTKATIVTVTEDYFKLGADWVNTREMYTKRDNKLSQMVLEGKTNGSQDQVSHGVTVREWVDLSAAEEFKTFVFEINTEYGGNLIQSVDIEDMT